MTGLWLVAYAFGQIYMPIGGWVSTPQACYDMLPSQMMATFSNWPKDGFRVPGKKTVFMDDLRFTCVYSNDTPKMFDNINEYRQAKNPIFK